MKIYIQIIASLVIIGWGFFGLAYWIAHPELSQMQVFLHMIGVQ